MDFLIKQLLSLFISVITMGASEEKYQSELDNLPELSERINKRDSGEWKFRKIVSEKTGETHTYFELPSLRQDAPVLLCLHGFNTIGSVFFNFKGLSDKYRIIAYNLPDKSKFYKGNVEDFGLLLDDFSRIMEFDTIDLLGYSLGGGIAVNFTANTKVVTVNNLILVATTIFGSTPENQRQIRGMSDRLMKYPDYKLYALLVKGGQILGKLEKPEEKNNVPHESVLLKHVDWYRQVMKSFYWYNGVSDAKKIKSSVTVVHGKKDKLMSVREADAIKQVFPDAEFFIFDDAAHSLVWSHYREFDKILRRNKLNQSAIYLQDGKKDL